jgi:hypothetical protein
MSASPQTFSPNDGRRVRVVADAVVSSYINELAGNERRPPRRHRERERALPVAPSQPAALYLGAGSCARLHALPR